MKKGFFILLILVSAFYPSYAQQADYHICGNAEDQAEFIARLEQNKLVMEAMDLARDRGAIQYVPIHFHLVGDADGNGKIKEIRVLDQLCKLNEAFLPAEIQFYLSPHPTYGLFNYSINNNNVYLNQNNSLIMQLRRHPNAINVYIVEEPVSNNNNPGIVLAYYSPLNDWIVSRKTEVNGNNGNGTLPHEVGHFFTLPHTFFGYESNPFDAADPTWPNAPVLAPNGGGVTTERQNGTNCGTAADRICDTPPDYNFGLIWPNCSNYTGGARDPLGTLVDPMENNFMGYFQNCNPYAFTPNQMSIMRADLNSSQRNYLDNTFSPASSEIVSPTDLLVSPGAGAIPPHYNDVLLEWQEIPGATHYLVEIDIIPGFATVNNQTFIETGTSKLLTNLQSNRTYYWRVKPFNQLVGCATVRSRNFKTSTVALSTTEIEGLEAWQISPNPVSASTATINVVSEKSFEAALRITDAAGRTVLFQQGLNFPQGESTHSIQTGNLPNGLYFVSLESGNGRNVRKLSVLR